jgi:hypothetical protein
MSSNTNTTNAPYQLAQLNVARMLGPIDGPIMAGFVAKLDEINALAEASAGFVWRLVGDGNDATSLRPFDDDRMIVNMSVWQNFEALRAYTYHSDHAKVMAQRKQWFEQMTDMHMVLWWVPSGHQPSVTEAKERLQQLQQNGPSPAAFTFRQAFPPPTQSLAQSLAR